MTLEELAKIIDKRAKADPSESWTAKMLARGPNKCAQTFGEEAVEAVIEAARNDREELTKEAADVLFHFLLMLKSRKVPLSAVMDELASRTKQTGLAEKASRKG